MGLVEFAFGAATGIVGNTSYDGIKVILGSTFSKLETFANNNDKGSFRLALEVLMENNDEIKQQLEALQQGKDIKEIRQNHYGSGDNVAGDKIVS